MPLASSAGTTTGAPRHTHLLSQDSLGPRSWSSEPDLLALANRGASDDVIARQAQHKIQPALSRLRPPAGASFSVPGSGAGHGPARGTDQPGPRLEMDLVQRSAASLPSLAPEPAAARAVHHGGRRAQPQQQVLPGTCLDDEDGGCECGGEEPSAAGAAADGQPPATVGDAAAYLLDSGGGPQLHLLHLHSPSQQQLHVKAHSRLHLHAAHPQHGPPARSRSQHSEPGGSGSDTPGSSLAQRPGSPSKASTRFSSMSAASAAADVLAPRSSSSSSSSAWEQPPQPPQPPPPGRIGRLASLFRAGSAASTPRSDSDASSGFDGAPELLRNRSPGGRGRGPWRSSSPASSDGSFLELPGGRPMVSTDGSAAVASGSGDRDNPFASGSFIGSPRQGSRLSSLVDWANWAAGRRRQLSSVTPMEAGDWLGCWACWAAWLGCI